VAIRHTMQVEGDTLVVQASGFDGSLAEVERYGLAVIAACVEHGVTRVLCLEQELEYRLGTMDTFRAAEFIAAQAPRVGRVAVVCAPGALPDGQFWENVVVNRGLTASVFVDEEAAVRWLRAEPGSAEWDGLSQPRHAG